MEWIDLAASAIGTGAGLIASGQQNRTAREVELANIAAASAAQQEKIKITQYAILAVVGIIGLLLIAKILK